MRKILFRGKSVDNDEWVEGYYVCVMSDQHRIYTGYAETDTDGYSKTYYPDFYTVIPETVGQYTGLTDKNGNKIFEGDIVDLSYFLIADYGVVKFGKHKDMNMSNDYVCGHLGFYIEIVENDYKHDTTRQDILFFANKCKVIGNIYDNPELLEKTE